MLYIQYEIKQTNKPIKSKSCSVMTFFDITSEANCNCWISSYSLRSSFFLFSSAYLLRVKMPGYKIPWSEASFTSCTNFEQFTTSFFSHRLELWSGGHWTCWIWFYSLHRLYIQPHVQAYLLNSTAWEVRCSLSLADGRSRYSNGDGIHCVADDLSIGYSRSPPPDLCQLGRY